MVPEMDCAVITSLYCVCVCVCVPATSDLALNYKRIDLLLACLSERVMHCVASLCNHTDCFIIFDYLE
jgi:hypothetical protein